MVCVHAYEFIIRRNHYSIIGSICDSYMFPFFNSWNQWIPILLPVFHRIKIHSCSIYGIGVIGFEPTAPASQKQCSTKLSYTPLVLINHCDKTMCIEEKQDWSKCCWNEWSSFIMLVHSFCYRLINHFLNFLFSHCIFLQRKIRDSNPRTLLTLLVFKTNAINHSANLPLLYLPDFKVKFSYLSMSSLFLVCQVLIRQDTFLFGFLVWV